MVTGKIFEAIGLGTPILLVAPNGSDAHTVVDTAGRGRAFTADDIDGIASFLADLIDGKSLEPKGIGAYAWGSLVGELDHILRATLRE